MIITLKALAGHLSCEKKLSMTQVYNGKNDFYSREDCCNRDRDHCNGDWSEGERLDSTLNTRTGGNLSRGTGWLWVASG